MRSGARMYTKNKIRNLALFGMKIRQRRARLELTQKSLAKKVDITPESISQIENGHRLPSVPILFKLAIALECKSDFLIGLGE